MNKNAKAIKDAIERRVIIAGLIVEGAIELEKIDFALDSYAMGVQGLSRKQHDDLEYRKGVLEDAQAELPAESDDLQSYVDKLLDPEAAWPDEDEQSRDWLCMYQRERIARYCDPVLRAEAMPN